MAASRHRTRIAKSSKLPGNVNALELAAVNKALGDLVSVNKDAPGGQIETGLHTDTEKEMFVSKYGDLVGVVRMKRKDDGSWSASMMKSNLPRVLAEEAVRDGLMPPLGQSALPKSLEKVLPAEYHYWKMGTPDEARAVRDALVESGFLGDDCIKAVDGELRKVEVKYFLYEPHNSDAVVEAKARPMTLPEKVAAALPEDVANEGALVLGSPAAVETVPAEKAWLVECADTRANRAELRSKGQLFKLYGEAGRLFAASFAPSASPVVQLLKGDAVTTADFQGIGIKIDRPKGFVQTGKDADGNEWSRTYQLDYGFIPFTKGGDGEELDVFLGPDSKSKTAYWVTQSKADGSFDEYKLFLGFSTPRDVRDAYVAHIPLKFYSGMTEMPVEQLKALLDLEPQEVLKRVRKLEVSNTEKQNAVEAALRETLQVDKNGPWPYVSDLYDDSAVYAFEGATYRVPFTYANGKVTLGTPVQVLRQYVPVDQAAAGSAEAAKTPHQAPSLKVAKAGTAGDERYVLGIVLEPDIVDAQKDTYSADEIRQAEHKFMDEYRNMGLMHKDLVNEQVRILESYLAPVDFDLNGVSIKKGTWLMAVRVLDDTLWDAVKKGKLTGYSIGGSALRKPV